MTLGEAANRFLTAKKEAAELGTLTDRTFREYQGSTSRFVALVGRDFPQSSVGPDQIHDLLDETGIHLRAMFALGIKRNVER